MLPEKVVFSVSGAFLLFVRFAHSSISYSDWIVEMPRDVLYSVENDLSSATVNCSTWISRTSVLYLPVQPPATSPSATWKCVRAFAVLISFSFPPFVCLFYNVVLLGTVQSPASGSRYILAYICRDKVGSLGKQCLKPLPRLEKYILDLIFKLYGLISIGS